VSHSLPGDPQRHRLSTVVPYQSYATPYAGSLQSTSSPSSSQIPSPLPGPDGGDEQYSSAHPDEILDSTDLELLTHYLTHTSRIIPFDVDELYALGVGIPNLAFRSKLLMSSILALAATCKSYDLVQQPQQDRKKILDLLNLADRHHRASLLQVQLDLPNACQYDYVLANSTLMVLYASANHCVRIRLAETQTKNDPLPRDFIFTQSQWISLIRAAHLAFVGLLNDRSETPDNRETNPEPSPTNTVPPGYNRAVSLKETISPENGPIERTKDLLLPILSATSGPALKALRSKARAIWKAQSGTAPHSGGCTVEDAGLQACFESLEILGGIMTEVFSAKDTFRPTSCPDQFYSGHNTPSLGRLSKVSGWLRNYVARVTSSAAGPRPLRRVIMAFLNRVPAEYLSLVQTTLDSIDVPIGIGQQELWVSSDFELLNPSSAQKLAIDIFAHWVVLVMLLDGVWWIGGIGAWELRRVVSFVRTQGWLDSQMHTEGSWWPESMYNVGAELKNLTSYK
jgi:hypothetical protein